MWGHSATHAASMTAGALASLGSLSVVVSMVGLLRYCLQQFIRRGAMNFTAASGAKFSCGDGTGEPVSVRFLTAEAERRVLLNPELRRGEVYVEGTFVLENGTVATTRGLVL